MVISPRKFGRAVGFRRRAPPCPRPAKALPARLRRRGAPVARGFRKPCRGFLPAPVAWPVPRMRPDRAQYV